MQIAFIFLVSIWRTRRIFTTHPTRHQKPIVRRGISSIHSRRIVGFMSRLNSGSDTVRPNRKKLLQLIE
jgi:hypothetical protein